MAFKPSSRPATPSSNKDFQARIRISEHYSDENIRKMQEVKKDNDKRKEIQMKIRALKDEGYTETETLEKLYSIFPDSEYRNFFRGWVENVYKVKPNKGKLPKLYNDGR